MAKIEMNNEIVLLRHAVRQARVCIINKLMKEVKLLRNKHGDKTLLEKYTKKADRLIAEIHALKTIQNDDITKFGIFNERDLTTILQDRSSNNRDRIIAKVAHYKTLYRRLMQFKEKFPDYKKYLTEKKEKTTKLRNKDVAKDKKSLVKNNFHVQDKCLRNQKINSVENVKNSQSNTKDEETCNNELLEATNNSRKRKKPLSEDNPCLEEQKLLKLKENKLQDTVLNRQSAITTLHNVTKEAVVKRFTEFLEEQESNKDVQMSVESPSPMHSTSEQAKTTDDFFLTEDGQNYYESTIDVATLSTRSQGQYTRTEPFQTSDRIKKQNIEYKHDTKFNKRYLNERSLATKSRKISNNINRSINKNDLNEVNNKEGQALHPSWLAKRKEQEIMSKGFQGKRTVFTDD